MVKSDALGDDETAVILSNDPFHQGLKEHGEFKQFTEEAKVSRNPTDISKMSTVHAHILGQAIALAADIHKDDLYGDGPYVFHLLQVLKSVQEQDERLEVQVAAILHDAIEDHPDAEDRIMQFLERQFCAASSDRVHDILKGLTRHYFGKETYNGFLDRVILDRDATVIKLADIQRNAAPKPGRTEHHIKLALERYIPALAKVTKALLAHEKARRAVAVEIGFRGGSGT